MSTVRAQGVTEVPKGPSVTKLKSTPGARTAVVPDYVDEKKVSTKLLIVVKKDTEIGGEHDRYYLNIPLVQDYLAQLRIILANPEIKGQSDIVGVLNEAVSKAQTSEEYQFLSGTTGAESEGHVQTMHIGASEWPEYFEKAKKLSMAPVEILPSKIKKHGLPPRPKLPKDDEPSPAQWMESSRKKLVSGQSSELIVVTQFQPRLQGKL
ncbi:hypothetical protein B0T26DRAFT_190347 [Lasiosphaeria miniovina]|uniref:Uncharacterized protein n=1 Tax=Lasiosphaeria miniovina TaxID=1954250 RepID=A0AA40ATC9_9PEZI|nr:uncharacterized protein B0T26DRAFT_190347 [Lasiosphaeria miniovina]KAK0721663.1 hypothetical protein B0T26DRAFT_190347 [Lasiosphaeria miniovina]